MSQRDGTELNGRI